MINRYYMRNFTYYILYRKIETELIYTLMYGRIN